MSFSHVKSVFYGNSIYFVTAEQLSAGRDDALVVKLALCGGLKVVQLREKMSVSPRENGFEYEREKKNLLQKAKIIRQLTWDYDAVFIMNDHVDIALAVDADGVHLGQEDTSIANARLLAKKANKNLFIGQSTHNADEIHQAKNDGADYINIGPIFFTKTKKNLVPPVTAENDKLLVSLIHLAKKLQLHFTVMGGIKNKHLAYLCGLGCTHMAMVSEICAQEDISGHVAGMISLVENCHKNRL